MQKITPLAVRSTSYLSGGVTFVGPAQFSPGGRQERLPFGTRGGILIRHTFPEDGEYIIKLRLARDTEDNIPAYSEPHDVEVTLDGQRVQLFTLEPGPQATGRGGYSLTRARQDVDVNL